MMNWIKSFGAAVGVLSIGFGILFGGGYLIFWLLVNHFEITIFSMLGIVILWFVINVAISWHEEFYE